MVKMSKTSDAIFHQLLCTINAFLRECRKGRVKDKIAARIFCYCLSLCGINRYDTNP